MGSFDLFHEAADRSTVTQTKTTGAVSGATVLNAEGAAFTLASAPATPFTEGQRVLAYDGVVGLAYCHVKKVTSSTNITLLPIQSAADTVTLPFQFPNGSAITVIDEIAAQQVIDLSEAPEDSYDFLILSNALIDTTASSAEIDISLRLGALQDDSLSGVSGYGAAHATLLGTNPDRLNFVAASKLTLLGGQRYENFVVFSGPNTNGVVTTVANPRLLALRVLGGYFAGDGKTVVGNTTSTSYVDYLDLGANLPAGQYLIVSTWALGSTSASAFADCVLEADGSTTLANQISQTPAVNNYIPGGYCGLVTLGATNRVRLRYKGGLGFNASIKNAFLAAVPVSMIPAFAAAHVSQDLATDVSSSIGTTFTAVKTSGSVTLETGRHIEIVSASFGGAAAFRSRPNFGGAGTGLGNHNPPPYGTNVAAYHPTFWFIRNRRTAGATTSAIEMRSQSGSNTLRARDFTFSWLREQPDFVAQPDEPVAVVADVELGGRVLKRWNSTTTTRRYSHRIDGERALSRVRVNGQTYTRVYSLSAVGDGTWFWDPLASDLYVQLTTAHFAIGAPESSGVNIVVVPLLQVGQQKHVLLDALGVRWLYRALLGGSPRVTQSIRSADGKFSQSASLGSLEVIASHGEFDDKLFRAASLDSYRAKIRRGFPRKSKRLEDMEVMADAVLRRVGTDFEKVSFQLLDRRRLMQTPVCQTKITVRESYGTNARSRDDQEMDMIWGPSLGVAAYRVTANETGGATFNTYQFCAHGVKGIAAVYLDAERSKKVAAADLDTTSTYTNQGQLRMQNDALGAAPLDTQPPDVIYVDLVGGRTSDGTAAGVAIQTPGAIARDIVAAADIGATPAVRLIERTFRMIDRRWRWQQITGGGGRRPVPPRISFIVSGKTTVEEALSQLCGDSVAYWLVNHQDRIGLDVPDFDRGNQARNGGFEDDSATAYPWKAINGGTLSLTTARKYAGARSAEISNGSPVNTEGGAAESIVLAAGGTHVITMVASLLEGVSSAFRIGVVGPSGVETLSEPQTLGTGRWSRHSLVYDSEPGDAGFTELRIYPAHGSSTATRVAVDEVEVYRVACVTTRQKSTPVSIEFEDEHFYECESRYAVNRANPDRASKRRINESEARGLSAAIEPEGKFAVQSSKRAELDTFAADGESAGGLDAAVVLYHSRGRPVLTIDVEGLDRVPLVGEYAYHRDNPRIPETADEYPIWRISNVGTLGDSAKDVRLEMRHQIDPVTDRIDIAPDNIPMGAGALTLIPGSITDYGEQTAYQDQYLMGARKPDLVTQRGDFFHKHSLSHVHPIPAHDHDVTPQSHGIDTAGAPGLTWAVKYDGTYGYPAPAGPQEPVNVSRGATDGGHLHNVPGTPVSLGEQRWDELAT